MGKGEGSSEALNFSSNAFEHNKDDVVGEFSVLKEPDQRLITVDEEAFNAMDSGDYDKALILRMQGMALVKLCLADPDSGSEGEDLLINAHIRLGETYYALGYTEQVLWHAKKAMELCDQSGSDKAAQILIISALVILSKGMLMKGDKEAIHYLQRARSLNYDLNGEEDITNVPIYEAFAEFYVFLGDCKLHSLSASPLEEEPQPGKFCPISEEDSEMNFLDYDKSDDYSKAVRELKQAWELLKKRPESYKSCKFDLEIPSVASVLVKISQKYESSSTALEKAVKYCKEQLDIGMENPLTMDVIKQQGITFYEAGNPEAAKEAFEELQSIQLKVHGSNSIEVAETLKSLGDVCIAQKQQSEAANHYNRALRILRKKLGPSNQGVRQLVNYIKQLNLPKSCDKSHSQSPARRPHSPDRMKPVYVSS